jgi:hypothetical protein
MGDEMNELENVIPDWKRKGFMNKEHYIGWKVFNDMDCLFDEIESVYDQVTSGDKNEN